MKWLNSSMGTVNKTLGLLVLSAVFFAKPVLAGEATDTLKTTVDSLLAVMSQTDLDDETKKAQVSDIVAGKVDWNATAQRILAKNWKKATDEEKEQFKSLFKNVLTNTYYTLLKSYTDEEVIYLGEKIKKERYAFVDTQIVSGGKKIPVTYRMIKRQGEWKIYDFVAEGSSLVRTYGRTYATTVKKSGISGLNASLLAEQADKDS